MTRAPARSLPRRRGFSIRGVILAMSLVAVVPVAAWSLWPAVHWSAEESGPMMYTVDRAEFVHDITDRGNVESANNIEIRCEVKSKNLSGTTILEIVPEGTVVKEGDVLAKLDSSALESDRTKQQMDCANSEALVAQATNVYDTAQIAKQEFLEGLYKQQVQMMEADIFVAQENLSRAEEYFQYSQRLATKGYVTEQQLKADRFAVEKARKDLETAKTKLTVMQDYTREKTARSLDADIRTARAKLKAAEAAHQLDMENLALIETQIKRCVIAAPADGQVVYANVTGYRGTKEVMIAAGETVRERQIMFRLPDPKRMQVVAKVNEAKVALVAPGMPALIHLDAFPDLELRGTVDRVNEFPVPSGWFGSSVKEYETTVRIHDSPAGLRPGLTAEVTIHVERLTSALQVPVQAVIEHGDKHFCVLRSGQGWKAQEVSIGSSNDKTIVIRGGVDAGQQVVLNAGSYREKVALPDLPRETAPVIAVTPGQRASSPAGKEVAAKGKPDKAPRKDKDDPAAIAAMAAKLFEQYDRNHDGRLERDEVPEQFQVRFQNVDSKNAPGIDRAQWAAVLSQVPKHTEHGRLKP